MQILNFKYKQNNKFKEVLNFKYEYEQNQQLLFSYKRLQNILNTSAFNKPVAAIKVAAGFVTMQELWASKRKPIREENNFTSINKKNYLKIDEKQSLANHKINILNKYNNYYGEYKYKSLNIYKDDIAFKYISYTNIYKNIFANKNENVLNKIKSYLLYYKKYNISYIKEYFITKPNYITSLFKNYYSIKNISITDIYKSYIGNYKERIINLNKDVFGLYNKKLTNKFKNIYAIKNINNVLLNKLEFSINENKYTELFRLSIGYKNRITSEINKNIFGINNSKHINLNKDYFGIFYLKNTNLFKGIFGEKEKLLSNINKNIFADGSYRNIFKFKDVFSNNINKNISLNKIYFSRKDNINISINKNVFSSKSYILSDVNNYLFAKKYYLNTEVNKHYFGFKKYVNVHSNEYLFGKGTPKESFTIYGIHMYKNTNNPFVEYKNIMFYKNIYKSLYDYENLFLYHNYRDTKTSYENLMLYKNNIKINIEINNIFLNKDKSNIYIDNYKKVFLHKSKRDIFKKESFSLNSISRNSDYFKNTDISLKLLKKDISNFNMQLFLNLSKKDTYVFNEKIFFIKDLIDINIQKDSDFLVKNVKDLHFINKYFGILVPAFSTKRNTIINNINIFCDKLSKEVDNFGFIQSSKINLKINLFNEDLFLSKDTHKIYIQNRNYWFNKNKFLIDYQKDIALEKKLRNINIFKQEGFEKHSKKINAFTQVRAKRKEYIINIDKQIEILKKDKNVYLFNKYFLQKELKITYINKELFTGIIDRYTSLFEQKMAFRKIGEVNILNLSPLFRNDRYINLADCDFIFNKSLKDIELFKQLETIHTLSKESRIADHIGDWAWAYEPPDPFNSNAFGIDELLLPEVDTRYEDFEDLIFNKNTQKPRNPIKVIDSDTWIAKLPPRHPLPERKSIGNVYTGVIRENYFGIRTSIMHQVYLEFYTLWQSHIFEFASMTMLQSLKKMLDYLYAYILDNYNDSQLPEALRIYHQIRWFGECAVLNNAQYIVSIERDTLKSNLHTGGCDIPNNLNTQDTMYIDSTPGICAIRNNEAYIGSSNAYVEFYLKTHGNTSIRFDLINTIGSVNIYIDNKLIDTISTSKIGLVYLLDYTGETITVRIEKKKESNLNNRFYICNISVERESFKDLSIDFDPMLKAGNAPMDEIAKKMIQYANQYDDIIEAYEHIKKANLGVSVTFDQMTDYWEKHHQDKLKGKRLTIKRT